MTELRWIFWGRGIKIHRDRAVFHYFVRRERGDGVCFALDSDRVPLIERVFSLSALPLCLPWL